MTTGTDGLLVGAFVEKAYLCPFAALLRVRFEGESTLVLAGAARGARGVGLLEDSERKAAKAIFEGVAQRKLSVLEGGRVVGIGPRDVGVEVKGVAWALSVEAARVVLERRAPEGALALPGERVALLSRGREMLVALAGEGFLRRKADLVVSIDRAVKRVDKRRAAVVSDLARLDEAEAHSGKARWFVAAAARAPRGATSLKVVDWSTGEARELELPLDPSKPAQEQVETLFKRARGIKRGRGIATERLSAATLRLSQLAELRQSASAAEDLATLDAIATRGRLDAAGDFTAAAAATGPRRAPQPRRLPYRTFATATGERILVGRSAKDNDELTLRVARPHDLWLHTRGRTGAHVIVPLARGQECAPQTFADATHLAAHFSEARGEDFVEIESTRRCYLRKPRGAPTGAILVSREKVAALRPDRARIERLLASEILPT